MSPLVPETDLPPTTDIPRDPDDVLIRGEPVVVGEDDGPEFIAVKIQPVSMEEPETVEEKEEPEPV